MDVYKKSLELHKELNGKISIENKAKIDSKENLSLLYSPGVAQPCLEIENDPFLAYDYTIKSNTIAVVSDGSAVLGIGNIKGLASIPVMEGKAALFKEFANINAFPICLDTQNDEEIINTVVNIAPVFGGINLEDIKAPRCFYIEEELKKRLDIPVFHDDQHGTAIVTLAGLINALKVVNKKKEDVIIVVNGLGSAGFAIIKLLINYGFKNFRLCGREGLLYDNVLTPANIDTIVDDIALLKKSNKEFPTLQQAIINSDIFIGVSGPDILTKEDIKSMNNDPIIFALANPNPEIKYELAIEAGVKVIATGRSDYPNQVNNVLVFPGVFKGALEVRASEINLEMKLAAVNALASIVSDEELDPLYIIPNPFDSRVVERVSQAVKKAAIDTKVARI